MFNRNLLSDYLLFGTTAAIAFAVPMIVFLTKGKYDDIWLLFLGNLLFLCVICFFLLSFNRRHTDEESAQSRVASGHITTFVGLFVAALLAFVAMWIVNPGAINSSRPDVLINAPAQTGNGETHGMVFVLFMNAVIGNLCGGSFASIMIPYSASRNQTKDDSSRALNS